ncbi:hypothetical protein GIB67_026062 [Kingdonia uniflora]|uniref:ZC3H15/TMA46 family C-terminal domain-containing protein n=1 Tax=Kingdonia uniflora TaxID=39325 RepID=A0A7J7M2Y4_9MAGN|nr:hypothetical protein GIB67_026062 [Kingdonia uniflora]
MGVEEEQTIKERVSRPTISQSEFLSWKRLKEADASAKKAEAARQRADGILVGTVPMNGRELFLHEPEVFDNTRY